MTIIEKIITATCLILVFLIGVSLAVFMYFAFIRIIWG